MHRFHGGFTEIFHLHCWGFWLSFYFTKRKREKSKERYPQFFSMHALSFAAGEKQEGRKTMEEYFQKIKHQMLRFIRNDEKIRPHIFSERLSKEVYVDYIFTLFLSILFDERADQEAFLEFVKNYLY